MKAALVFRWVGTTAALTLLSFAPALGAESDHLKGYKVKDLNQVVPPLSNTVVDVVGSGACELKKAHFMLLPATKDGGDDPRGGPAGTFVCYKAKCDGALPPTMGADTQFGVLDLETKKAKLVCLPAGPYCGDNVATGSEQCDGTDDAACPGICHGDCTCGVACGSTAPPSCTGGECPAGQMCADDLLSCGCIPIGSTPCNDTSPTCGGTCPIGQTCAETVPSSGFCGCL